MLLITVMANAYDIEYQGVYYNFIDNDSVEVTKGDIVYQGDIVIPNLVVYNDHIYQVARIDESALYYCTGLTSITIKTKQVLSLVSPPHFRSLDFVN